MPELDLVVSVCHRSTLPIWRQTARFALRNIDACRRIVAVPDDQVSEFEDNTPSSYEVVPETQYVGDLRSRLAARLRGTNEAARIGWYLQQFVKLGAVLAEASSGTALIWDADTIPVRPLRFVDPQGRLIYRKGSEYHEPYFRLIGDLLGTHDRAGFSFIAQCFPIRGEWLGEMIRHVEDRAGVDWQAAIAALIDPAAGYSFSEYETMGAFITAQHSEDITITDAPWFRAGGTYFRPGGLLIPAYLHLLGRRYEFIAFEPQDRTTIRRTVAGALRVLTGRL